MAPKPTLTQPPFRRIAIALVFDTLSCCRHYIVDATSIRLAKEESLPSDLSNLHDQCQSANKELRAGMMLLWDSRHTRIPGLRCDKLFKVQQNRHSPESRDAAAAVTALVAATDPSSVAARASAHTQRIVGGGECEKLLQVK